MSDTDAELAGPRTASITLGIHPLIGKDDYIINAESEGLAGGEETLLLVLKQFVATLEERVPVRK